MMKPVSSGQIINKKDVHDEYALVVDNYIGAYVLIADADGVVHISTGKQTSKEKNDYFNYLKNEHFPHHRAIKKYRNIDEYLFTFESHIYEINKLYLKIASGDVRQVYLTKNEKNEVVFLEERLSPEHEEKILTREQIEEMLGDYHVNVYSDSLTDTNSRFPSEEEILDRYVSDAKAMYESGLITFDKEILENINKYNDGVNSGALTLDDVNIGFPFFHRVLVITSNGEVKEVKKVNFKYIDNGKYKMNSYCYKVDLKIKEKINNTKATR